jgi:hypothetical protein
MYGDVAAIILQGKRLATVVVSLLQQDVGRK